MRTQPRCKYSGVCGGCTWQHVDYAAQLDAKRQSVKEALIHHGGCHNIEVQPVIGADSIYAYRNKMEFSFSAHRWLTPQEIATGEPLRTNFALGLHVPGNFAKVVDLTECHLPPPKAVRLVNGLRRFVQERDWKPWNIRRHEGYLRHLVLRTAHELPEYMVNLVTFGHDPERMDMLATWLRSEHAEVTTFVNTVHTGLAQTVYGEATHTVFGSGVIHDMMKPVPPVTKAVFPIWRVVRVCLIALRPQTNHVFYVVGVRKQVYGLNTVNVVGVCEHCHIAGL